MVGSITRRTAIGWVGCAGFGGAAAAQETRTFYNDRIAIEVSKGDETAMAAALNMAVELARDYAVRGAPVTIRVIAHGPGLKLLREDASPIVKRLKFAARSMKSISFAACRASIGLVARREGAPPPILSLAGRVADGPTTIQELEAQGWTVIRQR